MAIAKVENYNGAPALIIDGKPYPPMYATIRTINGEEMVIDEEYYKKLGEAGIKVYFLICDTEWIKKGAFKLFSEEAEKLLRAVPDAYIVMRISMHAPPEWCEANPDETLSYSDGKIFLTEDDELLISEWFRFRCNIDATGDLTSGVPSDLESAQAVKEVHSYTGADCQMPSAIAHLANAITKVNNELYALKCHLEIGDNVVIASLEQSDRFILLDKVLKKVEQ